MKRFYLLLIIAWAIYAQEHEHPKQQIVGWKDTALKVACDPAIVATPLIAYCTYNFCPSLPYPYICALGAGTSCTCVNSCPFEEEEDPDYVGYFSLQMGNKLKKVFSALLPCIPWTNLSKTKQE